MESSQSFELNLSNTERSWDVGFAVHQMIINEVEEILIKSIKNIPQIEELLIAVLELIQESNYGRDEFFTLVEYLKSLNKKLACKYLKEYQRIYSSKIFY